MCVFVQPELMLGGGGGGGGRGDGICTRAPVSTHLGPLLWQEQQEGRWTE